MTKKSYQGKTVSFEKSNGPNPKVGPEPRNLRTALEEFEKHYILEVFEQNYRNRKDTAATLGIDRKTLYRKLKKYGIM